LHLFTSYIDKAMAPMREGYRQFRGNGRLTLCCLQWLGVLSLSLLLNHTASFALNTEEQQMAEGVGTIIKQNQAKARAQAINNALRTALEQALLTALDPLELMNNAQALERALYARTLTYIRSYRVLWEYPDLQQRVYRVGIEANLALSEIDKSIGALAFSQSAAGKGRLLVLIMEQHLERPHPNAFNGSDGVVAQTLRSYLDTHHIQTIRLTPETLWDGQTSSALVAGKRAGAEAVLIGQAKAEKVRSNVAGMPLQTVNASVHVQVLATATGRQLAVEHIEATAIHTDAVLGGTQALRKAATEVASRLSSPLRQHLMR
jgi:hypothetical protein